MVERDRSYLKDEDKNKEKFMRLKKDEYQNIRRRIFRSGDIAEFQS